MHSFIILVGTPALDRRVVPVRRRLWPVKYPLYPADSMRSETIFPILFSPTTWYLYQHTGVGLHRLCR